jgi:hypothetical protein
MPPWPGIESPKSLMWKVRLMPDAKKPPKGAISEAKVARIRMWNCRGSTSKLGGMPVHSGSG